LKIRFVHRLAFKNLQDVCASVRPHNLA
jgi:hypothetical protein